jgi:transcriptional regulator with XRE-family HTH domain
LTEWERPYLEGFGRELRRLRQGAGLSQEGLATAAGLTERSLRRLEKAERRTRRSTIERLVLPLAAALPDWEPQQLQRHLLVILGPALALESEYRDRVEIRRARRRRKHARLYVTQHTVLYQPVVGGTLELHFHSRRTSRRRTRDNEYALLCDHSGRRRRLTSSGQTFCGADTSLFGAST